MKKEKKIRRKSEESGIALLLSIFVLLLVCVVGIAMLAASGTETSLTGNYRSSTAVYYAAISGLEEGRGRLLPRNPNYLGTTLVPSILPLGNVIYITNPVGSEPLDTTGPYPDTDYALEFPTQNPPSNTIVSSAPTITNPAGTPNPLYKWVRINALTKYALQIDVDKSGSTSDAAAKTNMVYFDGITENLTMTATSYQPLEVTALAALPDGSRKLLQYVVAPVALKVPVAAALTLAGPGTIGNVISFNPPNSAHSFYITGRDQDPLESGGLSCTHQPDLPAVGVYNGNDYTSVYNSLSAPPPSRPDQFPGAGGSHTSPSVSVLSPAPNIPFVLDMSDPISLSNFVATISNNADSVITGPATGSDMPAGMSPTNPMTVVVNGDLTLNGYTGYGLLVVTGTLTYTSDSGWKGIVLVIGQGAVNQAGGSTDTEFDGAVFIAKTNGGGTSLGRATYTVSNPSGKGIYYDSCWIAQALRPTSYRTLAFHEIPYP